jgi:threonine-phosphate decarboxylase
MAVDFPKKVVHGGTGKWQREKTHKKVLDFSASINPFPPQCSWDRENVSLEWYPDDQYHCLKERIGTTFHRDPEEICVGNGSIEIIRVFCSVALGRNKTFFLPRPTFGEYELSARLTGAEVAADQRNADVSFICNPNNPTGLLQTRSAMKTHLSSMAAAGGILFCDEAFIGLADPAQSLADVKDPHLFVLHSLTKTFSVPGIRFGFGFGEPELVEKIETARSPWSVNSFAESFAMEALCHLGELEASRHAIGIERDWLAARFSELGQSCSPSSVNYLLVRCTVPAAVLCDRLANRDILVRDCTSFGLADCIRVAVRRREENRCLVEALSACLH